MQSDFRTRTTSSRVGERIVLNYTLVQETSKPVHSINATILVNGVRVGNLNVDTQGKYSGMNIDKNDLITMEEMAAVSGSFFQSCQDILNETV